MRLCRGRRRRRTHPPISPRDRSRPRPCCAGRWWYRPPWQRARYAWLPDARASPPLKRNETWLGPPIGRTKPTRLASAGEFPARVGVMPECRANATFESKCTDRRQSRGGELLVESDGALQGRPLVETVDIGPE